MQAKLDELIRATEGAHNGLLDLEELEEREIEHIRRNYRELAETARKEIKKGLTDTDCRELVEAVKELDHDEKSSKPRRKVG
jgi:low affinity Fe/Cu permease